MADDSEELRPATREELLDSLASAMRCQGRRRVRDDHADGFIPPPDPAVRAQLKN